MMSSSAKRGRKRGGKVASAEFRQHNENMAEQGATERGQ